MTTYSEQEFRESISRLLEANNLTWGQFAELGKSGDLEEVDETLAFAYANLREELKLAV